MSSTRRLFIAVGPWQLVTLAAATKQASVQVGAGDVLILQESYSPTPQLKEAMHAVAAALFPGANIVPVFDSLAADRLKTVSDPQPILDEIRAACGEGPSEIWMPKLNHRPERFILESYPEAPITLYEDGTGTFVDIPVLGPGPLRAMAGRTLRALGLKPQAVDVGDGSYLATRHYQRLTRAILYLQRDLQLPEYLKDKQVISIGDDVLRGRIAACAQLPTLREATASSNLQPPIALMLGQSMARSGLIELKDEIEIYRRSVAAVIGKGYSVLWRDHPRAHQPYFDSMGDIAEPDRLRRLDFPSGYPVEIFVPHLGLSACISGVSSALLYLKNLYGIPGYSFADDLRPYLKSDTNFRAINQQMAGHVAALSQLPRGSMHRALQTGWAGGFYSSDTTPAGLASS
jgi:hypothetical protein